MKLHLYKYLENHSSNEVALGNIERIGLEGCESFVSHIFLYWFLRYLKVNRGKISMDYPTYLCGERSYLNDLGMKLKHLMGSIHYFNNHIFPINSGGAMVQNVGIFSLILGN